MKRLTLDETWERCLQMWHDITEQRKKDDLPDVSTLKERWVEKHGYYDENELRSNCFFCEYAGNAVPGEWECPAKKIDPQFSCVNPAYYYRDLPIKFYEKLVELNKKRLEKK